LGGETFDLVVSDGVLDHVRFSEAKSILAEIRRVSTPDGYLFVSLRSTADSECGRGEQVGENTYILNDGYEKGMLQHFFDRRSIDELLDGYEIFDVEHLKREFPAGFGVDKSYLQSSEGMKKQIELQDAEFSLQHARWWIAAKYSE
jgi:SAM-dependent methyltransferase